MLPRVAALTSRSRPSVACVVDVSQSAWSLFLEAGRTSLVLGRVQTGTWQLSRTAGQLEAARSRCWGSPPPSRCSLPPPRGFIVIASAERVMEHLPSDLRELVV